MRTKTKPMKKILFLFGFTLGLVFNTLAQYPNPELGEIFEDEIELTKYDKDSTAEAVVLFDVGKTYYNQLEYSFNLVFERMTRIKILKESGIRWAEFEIPFYYYNNEPELVYGISAVAYNYEDGKLKKTWINETNVFTQKIGSRRGIKKIAIPNVKKGTIIEFAYTIETPNITFIRNWDFQWEIPVIYTEYQFHSIPFFDYTWLLQGAKKFDVVMQRKDFGIQWFHGIEYSETINTFRMYNVPAFKDEEFITSIDDYIIKLNFQLARVNHSDGKTEFLTSWSDLSRLFYKDEDYGKYMRKSESFLSTIFNLDSLKKHNQKERFDLIVNYVKNNFSYKNEIGDFASKTPKNFINDKFGSSAEINLFLAGLLNASGIEAYPVLMSTRNNGKIKYDYPFLLFFNYTIVSANVDGKIVLTDATETNCLNDRIPPRCINDKGLIINNKEVEWADLTTDRPSETLTNLSIGLSDSKINASIHIRANEYDALSLRNSFGNDKNKILKKYTQKDYQLYESGINIKNANNKEESYLLQLNLNYPLTEINNKIYLSPFLDEVIYENPLKSESRTYPIDMSYPNKKSFTSEIQIPDNYSVDYMPENYEVDNELFTVAYKVLKNDSKVNVSFMYHFKNSLYQADKYDEIKGYFDQIVKRGSDKIILQKKSN